MLSNTFPSLERAKNQSKSKYHNTRIQTFLKDKQFYLSHIHFSLILKCALIRLHANQSLTENRFYINCSYPPTYSSGKSMLNYHFDRYCYLRFLFIFTLSIIRYGESFRDKRI